MTTLDEIFETVAVPDWLKDFDDDPFEAVSSALWGRYYFGHLNAAEPADLIIDWAIALKDQIDFVKRLDEALAVWINGNWGKRDGAGARKSATAIATAWTQLADIVANVEALKESARELRANFDDRQAFLGPLCEGPSLDPLGKYLYAVARHQEDRSLLPVWWNYCDLVAGVAWHYGFYGIWGLRGLPPTAEERGLFPERVAIGLARLAAGLHKRSLDKSIGSDDARAEFNRVARLTMAAYPFPKEWRACWEAQIASKRMPDAAIKWMSDLLPGLKDARPQKQRHSTWLTPPPGWYEEADRLAARLRKNAQAALSKAEEFLKSHQKYAEKTGDSYPLCVSSGILAKAIWNTKPEQAVKWAEESLMWEPWDAYSWSTLTQAMLRDRSKSIDLILEIAWEAIERFPDNAVARTGLAEVLKEGGRLDEAEQVYRDAVARFPDDAFARTGLAAILRLRGKEHLGEALELVEKTIRHEPTNVSAWTEQARILEQLGRMEEANAAFKQARALASHSASDVEQQEEQGDVLTPIADYETEASPLRASREKTYRHVSRSGAAALNSHARFLRRWARRNEATGESPSSAELRARAAEILDELIQAFPYQARARTEKGLLLLESGRLAEAKNLIEESIKLFPGDASLRYALARAERVIARNEKRRFDPARPDAIIAEWDRLRLLNPALRPLKNLGEGRAWLAQTDGNTVTKEALKSFKRIRDWMRPHLHFKGDAIFAQLAQMDDPESIRRRYEDKKGFEEWWSREVQAYLFGPIDINTELKKDHLELIEQRLQEYALPLDTLEEDFAIRLSF